MKKKAGASRNNVPPSHQKKNGKESLFILLSAAT
jgi:hypothetical protein